MTNGDRERKRKHSEAAPPAPSNQNQNQNKNPHRTHPTIHRHHPTAPQLSRPSHASSGNPYPNPHNRPPPPHHHHPHTQTTHDPRVLYGGYVEYTSGESPVPVRHPLQGAHRRHRSHQEGQTHGFDQREVFDRPGKRHRSQREYALDDIPSDGELSDTGADVGEVSFNASTSRLSQTFNTFNAALAGLLAIVDADPEKSFPLLDRTLGRERSSFVKTMKAMELEGTLPWLVKARAPSPDTSVAPSRVIQTTSGLTLEQIKPRIRSGSHEPSGPTSRKVSGASSVRSVSTTSSVPPVPFSSHTVETAKRAKIWPPELPPIKNDDIRKQVFSHKSIVDGASTMIGEAGLHNERLEFLGDSYLGAIVTRYIFSRFPNSREGAMTNIRSSIVGNKNIHEWCVMYKLEKHLITGEGKHSELVNRSKTLADLFEAYIGGLLLDSGPEVVDEWLKDLMEPKMKEAVEQFTKEKPLNKAAKNQISSMVGGRNVDIRYEWEGGGGGNQGGYHFTIYFTGWGITNKILGKGWGSNKTDASIRAAMNALDEGTALKEVKRAKQKWYEENPQSSGIPSSSDSGVGMRSELP
ncbi:hypothetical protein TWF102_008626 [Orbilia oligospora]|uniref:ribonuclease III n=1 Tax=Orbilia oligospora TaxID=2813651 RepID=A0A7C8J3L0_ORBOL|nr:hypothetical protein TWF102_008626 [Orbilia oligospora]KAF3094878.1 hypothetical protein TWF706_008149 [Orbilia oligospora]KAF3113719.1 hypothetical protein TWF103_002069 [Orbilia oligospora]